MVSKESQQPVGSGQYVVSQGECLGSIAYEHGFLLETLWNHPDNASLKAGRGDPKMLLPGDRVAIPDLRLGSVSCPTDKAYKFVKKGVSEILQIRLLDSDGNARASLRYLLMVDGVSQSGTTDERGSIKAPIPPNAREGKLTIFAADADEHYALHLGGIDPAVSVTGVQARLNNLGFYCGDVDGVIGPFTRRAIREFQESQGLEATGAIDDNTRNKLVEQHGF